MQYNFYPGCSMEATAAANRKSIEGIAKALDIELKEIPDWNCCGATIASGVKGDFVSQVLAARNLALAEKNGLDVVTGCSACYLSLALTDERFKKDHKFKEMANEALGAAGLRYNGTLRVRQILEVLINDIGLDKIRQRVKRPLTGLKVAGYVGCQAMRVEPWKFDDPENPVSLDRLIEALGATPVYFPLKTKCCGSSLSIPATEIVIKYSKDILESAKAGGAQIIVTPCPICQLNLDAYQVMINKTFNTSFKLPVLFFTQLMAIAFELPANAQALRYCIVSPYEVLTPYGVVH